MSLADLQALVDDLVRDKDQVITTEQRDTAIDGAVSRYSADAPRVLVEDVTSAGGQRLDLPAGWDANASEIRSIEYPVGHIPSIELDPEAWRVYTGPDGAEIVLLLTLLAGEDVRIAYTAPHALDAGTDTIPARHRRPVACLAAADLCGQLASYYATEGEPTIAADAVNHDSKSQRWSRRARDLAAEYQKTVGTVGDRAKGASATVELPRRDSLGGRRIFHPPGSWPR